MPQMIILYPAMQGKNANGGWQVAGGRLHVVADPKLCDEVKGTTPFMQSGIDPSPCPSPSGGEGTLIRSLFPQRKIAELPPGSLSP